MMCSSAIQKPVPQAKKGNYEIYTTVFMDLIVFICRRSAQIPDSPADSGIHLWASSASFCACFGLLPLESVKEISKFLIEIMPLMFIPAAVGLLESWGVLSGIFWQVAAATAVSTVLVMGVSGQVTQYLIRRQGRKQK